MPSDIAFRELLLDLDDEMSDEEHKRFIFLLGDDIPKRKRGEPLVEIFTILIDRGRISPTDCSYLVKMFERLKLFTVAYKIAHFEAQRSPQKIPESIQPIENVNVSHILTTENFQNQGSPVSELLNQFYSEDTMIITDSGQNSLNNTPNTIEPTLEIVQLFLENIDLKVFESEVWSNEFLEKIHVNNIHPYEYQRELVQSAIQAKNTIICLRTGGGKTFVAALLLKYYLIKKMTLSNGKKFLAFFIVPRRAMLKQQLEKLKQIGNLRIAACDENNDVTQYIDNYDVVVCTPQKLLNCLKVKTIFLSNIDLLCFDECHDSVVHNQYVGIMQYLMCTKIDHIPPVDPAPIIIGLTAIGVHQSNSPRIIHSLTVLCATFNCLKITTVLKKENEEELDRCVTRISEDEIICVDKQKDFESLRLSIEKELKNLILQLFVNKDTNPLRIFPEKDFNMNGYEQNLELLKQSEQKNQHFSSVLLLNYTLIIYRYLRALIDLTPEMVLSDLKDHFERTYKRREHPLEIDTLIYEQCQNIFKKKLAEIEESGKILSNPKLEKLVELLKKHADNPNSRALILVERTFYAKKIYEFLQNHSDLKNIIKPCWLVGQSVVGSGKTIQNQDAILEEFRTGIHNVMISTDVVQAGLNIPQCSLVLRYDFVPDSIGTVQARVRARAANCKYCLITTKDSPNYTKERDSRQYEQDLKKVLETWNSIPLDEFQRQVIETQESLVTKWNESFIKTLTSQTNISKNTELSGDVLCRACGFMLGELAQVRQHGHNYIISNHDFYNRIEEKMFAEPRVYAKSSETGKALCGSKNCRAELGCIQTLSDHPEIGPIYPLKCKSIKIKQIDKENGNERILLEKHWTKMPFSFPLLFEDLHTNNDDDIFYDAYDTPLSDL